MLATILLLGLVTIAAVTDVRRHKIYNATTYPGILAALGINALGEALLAFNGASPELLARWLGFVGLVECVLGLVACGFVMLVCYVMFRVGGGDVKLLTMMGAFLGTEKGIEAMLWTFVLGGCMGLIVLIWRVGPWRIVRGVFRQLMWAVRLGRFAPLSPEERRELRPPLFLAPCALAAAAIVRFSLLDWLTTM